MRRDGATADLVAVSHGWNTVNGRQVARPLAKKSLNGRNCFCCIKTELAVWVGNVEEDLAVVVHWWLTVPVGRRKEVMMVTSPWLSVGFLVVQVGCWRWSVLLAPASTTTT